MVPRRKPVNLTIIEKYDIILMKETGKSGRTIREKYGVSRSILTRISAQSKEIKRIFEYTTDAARHSRILLTLECTNDLDRVLSHWYLRCKERNVKITETDIRRKAIEINNKLNGHPSFAARSSWFLAFKKRYHITNADILEDVPIATEFAVARAFKLNFSILRHRCGCTLKNVYNVVYKTIMWKAVPEGTSILSSVKLTGNQKMCEDYVTALFCANATGCHKLPVLIIGKVPETHSLYNFNTDAFSTIYKSNPNACMNSTIFTQWYKEHFLESVKERQKKVNGRREHCLLLLDNATSLHDLDDLNKIDSFVIVVSPPLRVAEYRQPLSCGVITCFKRKYRKKLVETIKPLPVYNKVQEVIDLHKALSMWDCCYIVHDAWSNVDDAILKNSWNDLLRRRNRRSTENIAKWRNDVFETLELLHSLPGCEECDEVDVSNWFYIDNKYDIVNKTCTEEVLGEFKNNSLGEHLDMDIIDDLAGPSHS